MVKRHAARVLRIIRSTCNVCGGQIDAPRARRFCDECNAHPRLTYVASGALNRSIVWGLPRDIALRMLSDRCHYCGGTAGGIDRVDSSRGYVVGNTVPCCRTCNNMKSDTTLEAWLEQMRTILARHAA